MGTSVTIPADVIRDIRRGLCCLVGSAAEGIVQLVELPRHEYHPEWFQKPRAQLAGALALLDLLGPDAGCPPRHVDVELGAHGQTLREAVREYLPVREMQVREADLTDSWRVAHGQPPKKQRVIERLTALREFAALLEMRLTDTRL